MKVRFVTLGCKVNQFESESLGELFLKEGYELTEGEADLYVVNSCTVTSMADRKTRQTVRRLKREHPNAVVALTGCMPQSAPEAAYGIAEADIVLGSTNRAALVGAVERFFLTRERVTDVLPHLPGEAFEPMRAERFEGRQRAFLKIQDGCDRYCAYCVIPTTRGPVRSNPLEEIRRESARLVEKGYRELVLVGINLSLYGREQGLRLSDAVRAAASPHGDFRIRLGSVEPEIITDADYDSLSTIEKLCPHFHLALQSGCDDTLRRMNRRYDAAEYKRTAAYIRSVFPNASLTTDIVAGFPGETEEEFSKTCAFVREIGFLRAHVFEYSRRPGTAADGMPGQVPPEQKQERSRVLSQICRESGRLFAKTQVGLRCRVLLEKGAGGYSENYTYIAIPDRKGYPIGSLVDVLVTAAGDGECVGEIIN